MVSLSRISERAAGMRKGRGASIREVALIGGAGASSPIAPGDALAWAGRDYRVEAVDGGDYLHLRPADATSH